MTSNFNVGDKAVLATIPEWLVHDLPREDKERILACVGKPCVIEQIDQHGYIWPGFSQGGGTISDETRAWFCISADCLQAVPDEGTA